MDVLALLSLSISILKQTFIYMVSVLYVPKISDLVVKIALVTLTITDV